MQPISDTLLKLLRSVDTPTVCNAIEVVEGKRGFADFTRKTVHISDTTLAPMVGFAATAKIKAQEPPKAPKEEVRAMRMAYYKYMSEAPAPAICMIEDEDYPNCIGSYWGEVNTWAHKSLGLKGAITNSTMRDLDVLAPEFPVMSGAIGVSHGFVHVTAYDTPIELFGVKVRPMDLVHGDRHGFVVIPDHVKSDLEEGIHTLIKSENIVLDVAKKGPMSFEEFEKTWAAFENART